MKRIALAITLLASLAACGGEPSPKTHSNLYTLEDYSRVEEFRLADGIRCVVLIDSGITCDWGTNANTAQAAYELQLRALERLSTDAMELAVQ